MRDTPIIPTRTKEQEGQLKFIESLESRGIVWIPYCEVGNDQTGNFMVYHIDLEEYPDDEFDVGVVDVGGTARKVFLNLGKEVIDRWVPRDRDLAFISDFGPRLSLQAQMDILREYEPLSADYLLHRFDGLPTYSLADYMTSKDITLNEVFIHRGVLYASERAIRDAEARVIRPTEFQTFNLSGYYGDNAHEEIDKHDTYVQSWLLYKLVRIAASLGFDIADINEWQLNMEVDIDALSYQLTKAYQQDYKIAQMFYRRLIQYSTVGQIGSNYGVRLQDENGLSTKPLQANSADGLMAQINMRVAELGGERSQYTPNHLKDLAAELAAIGEFPTGDEEYDHAAHLANGYNKPIKKLNPRKEGRERKEKY